MPVVKGYWRGQASAAARGHGNRSRQKRAMVSAPIGSGWSPSTGTARPKRMRRRQPKIPKYPLKPDQPISGFRSHALNRSATISGRPCRYQGASKHPPVRSSSGDHSTGRKLPLSSFATSGDLNGSSPSQSRHRYFRPPLLTSINPMGLLHLRHRGGGMFLAMALTLYEGGSVTGLSVTDECRGRGAVITNGAPFVIRMPVNSAEQNNIALRPCGWGSPAPACENQQGPP